MDFCLLPPRRVSSTMPTFKFDDTPDPDPDPAVDFTDMLALVECVSVIRDTALPVLAAGASSGL